MNFRQAIKMMKVGRKVFRKKWVDPIWMFIPRCVKLNNNVTPPIYISIDGGKRFGFGSTCTPTQEDMLAEDWGALL